jgi:TonB family protein
MALKMPENWRSKASAHLILRISLLVSFLFHLVLLMSFQDAFSLFTEFEDLRIYTVELIRPPLDEMDREEKGRVDVAKPEADPTPHADETQETISLDTDDKRYVTYAGLIKERLKEAWSYPPDAKNRLIEGRLLMVFSLSREGALTRLEISRSSGHEILDLEAERAVRSASPFPPFPDHITVTRLNIEVSFDYQITAKRKKNTGDRMQETGEKQEQ